MSWSLILEQMSKSPKESRNWKDSGLIDWIDSDKKKKQIVRLFDILIDECVINRPECVNNSHCEGNSYYYLPCIVRVFNGLEEKINGMYYMSNEIVFDMYEFISYFNNNFDNITSALKSLEHIDYEAESVALICSNYVNMIFKIFRDEGLSQEYLNNIKHSLPTTVRRNINIDRIIS